MDNTVKRTIFDAAAWTIGLLAGMGIIAHDTMAGGKLAAPPNERFRSECGSCHIAYPPQLLSAHCMATDHVAARPALRDRRERRPGRRSGDRRIPRTLFRLRSGAMRFRPTAYASPKPAGSCMSTSEVPSAVWKLPAVKSAANCAACHTNAEQGDFRERNIRIPR